MASGRRPDLLHDLAGLNPFRRFFPPRLWQREEMRHSPRPATHDDLRAVQEIVGAAYSRYEARIGRKPGPMLDDYRALIDQGRVHVVECSGMVQGIVVLIPQHDAMLLDNVAVAPAAQGSGLGRAMLEFAEHAARAAGYRSIRLYTNEAMTENIALYSRI